jgi:hypothetical protein
MDNQQLIYLSIINLFDYVVQYNLIFKYIIYSYFESIKNLLHANYL